MAWLEAAQRVFRTLAGSAHARDPCLFRVDLFATACLPLRRENRKRYVFEYRIELFNPF